MPQLNPSPWLSILVFSWLVFLTILPLKVTAHIYPNEPAPQTAQTTDTLKTESWTWPWH
uniref:ATP synthase complex subunit 8 n=1 Tax=Nuchequula nuchalis TaxID=218810 RepID=A0A0B6VLS6_NUCNU|nr:ATP synthase F0 subunit 8 [Leiognathus brevirostris]UNI91568.1 ATP subunit 8 [Leiognathus brevirostris]BAQ20829.1 ATPase subunit 8 [Nuchequula nuchalis]